MPLPNITRTDLELALPDVMDANADLDALRDLLRIVTTLPADDVKRAVLGALRTHRAAVLSEFE